MSDLDLYLQLNVPSPIEDTAWNHWFEVWLQVLGVNFPCELTLCLTTDEHIRDLNREFRQVDQSTDVLAFAAQETLIPVGIKELQLFRLLGDIVISVPTARLQAKARGHKLSDELAWLAAHGLLHLLGWDHPDELSFQRMIHQQRQLLAAIHLHSEVTHGN
ncbi:MAG: rRNA maturation RNase YbeY [Synechococcaceae cyanobacterium SM2_3_1]|nr:rRNA maturation RNase YbeY [Synechococcaceae cyanobacterium SM2_3_1]